MIDHNGGSSLGSRTTHLWETSKMPRPSVKIRRLMAMLMDTCMYQGLTKCAAKASTVQATADPKQRTHITNHV